MSTKALDSIKDIPSLVKYWADVEPEKEVFVFFNESGRIATLTALDVYVLAGRFASRLRTMGFQRGDLITNAIPNSVERVVTDFGIIMAGCIGSNCMIMEKDGSDFWEVANRAKTAGIILPALKTNSAYSILQKYIPTDLLSKGYGDVAIPQVPSMKRIVLIGRSNKDTSKSYTSFLDNLRLSAEEIFQDEISPDSIAYVFGTSGTTGFSKLSPRTHEVIVAIGRTYRTGHPSKRFSQRPLGWIGGFPIQYLSDSSCIVIQDCFMGKVELSVKQLWTIVEDEGCTSGFMLPGEMEPFLTYFKDSPPNHRLKAVITGGQPLTKRVCDALGVITDCLILSYASTEMSGVTNGFVTSPEQMDDFMTGKPMPGVSLKIVDENMKEVENGKEGIILVKSPLGSNHYYNQELDKPTATEDGYFITGDRGWVNKDGVLYVSDRNDDVIFHGPVLVYPSWPESILIKMSDISEAVVMGVPASQSKKINDQLGACIVLMPGSRLSKENIIMSYNDSFTLTGDEFFPKLSYVEIFSKFPMGHTGKVNKKQLHKMLMERIGL